MIKINKKAVSLILVSFTLLAINALPILVLSANYQLLEPSIVLNQDAGTGEPIAPSLKDYLQNAYIVMFVLVVTAVVFWIIVGGLEYILSDLPSVKLGGKEKLKKALLGLAIALTSYLLLNLINPELLNFNLKLTP